MSRRIVTTPEADRCFVRSTPENLFLKRVVDGEVVLLRVIPWADISQILIQVDSICIERRSDNENIDMYVPEWRLALLEVLS